MSTDGAEDGQGTWARRVLLADDDDDIREVISMLLQDEGWEVVEAKDGAEALTHLLAEDFHAVVLDHRMPKLTGSEVYRQLVANGRQASVILVTAADSVEAIAADLGIRCFLGKPFSLGDLLEAVRDAPRRCS